MNPEQFPTKRNLMTAKRNLTLANQGHNLLDKKYKVLLRELAAVKFLANQLKRQLDDALQNATALLTVAKTEVGDRTLKKISDAQHLDTSLQITYRNIMGAMIPKMEGGTKKHTAPPYSLSESTASLDEALFAWQSVKVLLVKRIEAETAMQRITVQLQKAKKRAAALKNITIPLYESRIKYISNQLEERERDELVRIKKSQVSQ